MSSLIRRKPGFLTAERSSLLARAQRGARLAVLLGLGVVSGQGCVYSFRAGDFPSHIRTIAVLPFENETARLELTQELHDALLREVPRSLGLRQAGEDVADAVLRGRVMSYAVTVPAYRPGAAGDRAEVLQRQVTISIAVELVDQVRNEIIWESRGLSGEGQFLDTSETEDVGMRLAIALLRQRIIDGAQSNW
jgi:hypothetical protein